VVLLSVLQRDPGGRVGIIDGAEAARFVNTVIEYLESPALLLLY
jgi:hypothetical protein